MCFFQRLKACTAEDMTFPQVIIERGLKQVPEETDRAPGQSGAGDVMEVKRVAMEEEKRKDCECERQAPFGDWVG